MNGVTQRELSSLLLGLLWGLSDGPEDRGAAELRKSFSIKLRSETQVSGRLGVDPLDMPRTSYRTSEGKRSQ